MDITIDRNSHDKFSNPRMLLADFLIAEGFIRSVLKEMSQEKRFAPPMKMLIQPMDKLEGGLSPVEERSFMDLAEHVGAKYVFVHPTQERLDDTRVLELVRVKNRFSF